MICIMFFRAGNSASQTPATLTATQAECNEPEPRYCVILSLLTLGSKLREGPEGLHAAEKCDPCGYVIIV